MGGPMDFRYIVGPAITMKPGTCVTPRTAEFTGLYLFEPGISSRIKAWWTVDFGDGTPIQNYDPVNPLFGGGWKCQKFTHSYVNGNGNYTVTIKAYANQNRTQLEDTKTVDLNFGPVVFPFSCISEERSTGWQSLAITGTNLTMNCRLRIQHVNPWLLGWKSRGVAESELFEFTNNKYKKVKGQLYVLLNAQMKTSSCVNSTLLYGDMGGNSKDLLVHRTASSILSWSNVMSMHILTRNGTQYVKNLSINACD